MEPTRIQFPKLAFSKKFLVIWAVSFVAFAAFIATDLSWGGAALNGKVENSKYYLGEHGQFREVGGGYYAVSALLSMIWPVALVLGVLQLRTAFPATPDSKKLFLVLTIFFSLIAAAFFVGSLVCFLRVFI